VERTVKLWLAETTGPDRTVRHYLRHAVADIQFAAHPSSRLLCIFHQTHPFKVSNIPLAVAVTNRTNLPRRPPTPPHRYSYRYLLSALPRIPVCLLAELFAAGCYSSLSPDRSRIVPRQAPPDPVMDSYGVRRRDTTKGPPLRVLSLGMYPVHL
jgi:hypothetical protein